MIVFPKLESPRISNYDFLSNEISFLNWFHQDDLMTCDISQKAKIKNLKRIILALVSNCCMFQVKFSGKVVMMCKDGRNNLVPNIIFLMFSYAIFVFINLSFLFNFLVSAASSLYSYFATKLFFCSILSFWK